MTRVGGRNLESNNIHTLLWGRSSRVHECIGTFSSIILPPGPRSCTVPEPVYLSACLQGSLLFIELATRINGALFMH